MIEMPKQLFVPITPRSLTRLTAYEFDVRKAGHKRQKYIRENLLVHGTCDKDALAVAADAVEEVRFAISRAIERLHPVRDCMTISLCQQALVLLPAKRQEVQS